jgi:methylthioribulose-1-phosphate dehydratase
MPSFEHLSTRLAELGRALYDRGWAMGTSGNYSAVLEPEPLRLVITRSGVDKGGLLPGDMLVVDEEGKALRGAGKPSAETVVHLAVVRTTGAGAVLHTHSVWNTLLSETAEEGGAVEISGYEMLKGLRDVTTHEHAERVPVVDNTQDYDRMSRDVEAALAAHPEAHGLMLRGHGLYTWGRDLAEAKRHVEIFEFLFEVVGRRWAATGRLPERRPAAFAGGVDGGG